MFLALGSHSRAATSLVYTVTGNPISFPSTPSHSLPKGGRTRLEGSIGFGSVRCSETMKVEVRRSNTAMEEANTLGP